MLKLSFDITTGNAVQWKGSASSLPAFRQGKDDVQIRFVTPNPASLPGSGSFIIATLTGFLGPRIGLFTNSTFTANDSGGNVLALTPHDSFTLNTDDATDPYFSGTFNTNTDKVSALGAATSTTCYFSCVLVRTDLSISVIFDQRAGANATLYSATDDGFGALPVDVTGRGQSIKLPITAKDDASGEIYQLCRTAQGVLTWVWTNPPAP